MIIVNIWPPWSMVELKTRLEEWISTNDVNGVRFINFSYLITLMVYLCSQWNSDFQIKYFMFDWSIYRLFVLNRGWKRDSLHIKIFEFVSSTWNKVEQKTRFETWISRNDVNGVSLFHLSYLITLMVYQCSQRTPNVQMKYFMFDWSIYELFVIDRGRKRDFLQIMIYVYVCSTWDIVELRTRFETWITRNDLNGVSLFHPSYLIRPMTYMCSQRTPNVQIKYFVFDWSIYRLFVLNRVWKRDSQNNEIHINLLDIRHSWTKNAFREFNNQKCRKWYMFTFLILQHLWLTRAHKGHQLTKSSILCLNTRSTYSLC
jgi:hypothetical protein